MLKITQLCFSLALFCISYVGLSQTVYVATDGNDRNNGTINSPFQSFSKAISTMSAGDVCIIRDGIYEEELLVNKSGAAGNYLTFKAADGESVEIRATSFVNNWQLHNGNIYKASVNMSIDSRFRAVYYKNEYMDLARWPNNSDNDRWTLNSVPVTSGDGSTFNTSGIPNFDWTGGMVYYLGAHSGASWTRSITASNATTITHTGVDINKWPFTPHNPTIWRNNPGNNRGQLYLFNKLEALDYAREWYYENDSNTLYFQTPDGNMPDVNSVEIATHKFAAQLNGHHIKVENITFFGGSVKIKGANNIFINNEVIHGSEGHDNLGNTSASTGEASVEVLGENTLVANCTINHSSVNGITVQNWSGAHNSIIENNYISNIDYLGIHTTPIRVTAMGVKILKNTIINSARDGIYVNGLNCETAYNDVSHSQLINSDSGIFYTVGNTALKNSSIHHNWFHDATAPSYSHATGEVAKAAGIYLDNDSKGYTVHNNVIWNVSWSAYQVNWENNNLDFFHNTIWNAERAMDSWVNGRTQSNNKVYNNFSNVSDWFSETSSDFDIQHNLISATSPFVDANNQNFMPKVGSAIIDQAVVISNFDYNFKGISPDQGAYEYGGTPWTAGINAIEDTGEPLNTTEDVLTELKMYPNPTEHALNIVLPNHISTSNSKVVIYSLLGKRINTVLLNDSTNRTKQISVEHLAPSVYVVKVTTPNGAYTSKFIKN